MTETNKLLHKWETKSVALSQIKFDNDTNQAYYFSFEKKTQRKKQEQVQKEWELKEKEKLAQKERKKNEAVQTSDEIVDTMREYWEKGFSFGRVQREIENLSVYELIILNSNKAFKEKNGQPRIHHWFNIAKEKNRLFLYFILECPQLNIDYNVKSIDHKTIIQTLIENTDLLNTSYYLKQILKNGYVFKEGDIECLNHLHLKPKEIEAKKILCELSVKILDKALIEDLFHHSNLICTIESAKRGKIVGFGWNGNQWIAFANNAIQHYGEYWEYIELSFKHYGIWEKLIALDKKGTFKKKLQEYYVTRPEQKFDCDNLFKYLYPELGE